ncbi:hypothetical protein M885DRAFT_574298 [Pelagophyceae sp. CCMP2097]|nr:hypothetical protein M885DRAFT_574298 [Pelagophyceae sp. CCMP2097]
MGDVAQGAAAITTTLKEALRFNNRSVRPSNKFLLGLVAHRLPNCPDNFAKSLVELLPGSLDDSGRFKFNDFPVGGNTTAISSMAASFEVVAKHVPGLADGCDELFRKTGEIVRNGNDDICAKEELLRFGRTLYGHLKRLGSAKYTGTMAKHGLFEQKLQDEAVHAAEPAMKAAMLALFNKTSAASFGSAGVLARGAPSRQTVAQDKRKYDCGGAGGGLWQGDGSGAQQRGDGGATWQGGGGGARRQRGDGVGFWQGDGGGSRWQRDGGGGGFSRQRGGGDGGDARYRNGGGGGGGAGGGSRLWLCVNCLKTTDHQATNCPNRREPMSVAPANLEPRLIELAKRLQNRGADG